MLKLDAYKLQTKYMENKKLPNKTYLIKAKDVFKNELEDRIKLGKALELHNLQPRYRRSFGGYISPVTEKEMTDYEKDCLNEFRKWTSYNSEFLKQAFDNPKNEYYQHYEGSGMPFLFHGEIDLIKVSKDELDEKLNYLVNLIAKIPLLPSIDEDALNKENMKDTSKNVFIVHGHDSLIRTQVELFLKEIDFDPVVLFKQPNEGATIIEKLERESKDAVFSIVLYTSCDLGNDKENAIKTLNPRARQNVVFEHGYMCALLGRQKICALVEKGVEIPGDLSGLVYIDYDEKGAWKFSIAKEMIAAGLDVDLNKIQL